MGAMVGGGRGAGSDPRSPALAGGVARIRRDRARRGRRRNLPGRIAGGRRVARRAAREAAAEGRAILFDHRSNVRASNPAARTCITPLRTTRRTGKPRWRGALDGCSFRPGSRAKGSTSSGPGRPGRPADPGEDPRMRTFQDPTRIAALSRRARRAPERSRGLGRQVRRGIAGRDGGADSSGSGHRGRDVARVRGDDSARARSRSVEGPAEDPEVNVPGRNSTSASRRRSPRRLFAPTTTAGPSPSTRSGGTAR